MSTDASWGDDAIDPVKRVKNLTAALGRVSAKMTKVAAELQELIRDNPLGELLKCSDIPALAKLQLAAQACNEAGSAATSPAYSALEAVRKHVVPQAMENAGIETIRVVGVGTVSIRPDLFVSTIKGGGVLAPPLNDVGDVVSDAPEDTWSLIDSHEWLVREGHGALIQDTVNASSLKALIKKLIKDGTPVPTELFKITPVSYSVILKK